MSGTATPPAPGQEPAPAPAEGAAEAATDKTTNKGPILPVHMIEGIGKGVWSGMGKVLGFFWKRTKGVASGAYETTLGQVGSEMKEIGQRLGYETKDTELIPIIAGIIEDIGKKVGKVVGGVIDYTIGAPTRAIGRTARGLYNIGRGAILGETYKQGGGTGEAEAAAHGAHHS